MKFYTIIILAFVAAVSAGKGHTHEDVPVLKKACDCPAVNCPSQLMSKKSVCECQNAAALACYTKSERGCPEPKKNSC